MLVQGPYRTTPARDNIPRDDEWNRHLVGETAELLVDALRHLRDERLLTARVFETLPLDRDHFSEGSLLAPLFDSMYEAVASEPLLPAHRGGYVSARQARLTHQQGLRNLISRPQLRNCWAEMTLSRGLARYLKAAHGQVPPLPDSRARYPRGRSLGSVVAG